MPEGIGRRLGLACLAINLSLGRLPLPRKGIFYDVDNRDAASVDVGRGARCPHRRRREGEGQKVIRTRGKASRGQGGQEGSEMPRMQSRAVEEREEEVRRRPELRMPIMRKEVVRHHRHVAAFLKGVAGEDKADNDAGDVRSAYLDGIQVRRGDGGNGRLLEGQMPRRGPGLAAS